jgi:type IV pilus assembly protein PilV
MNSNQSGVGMVEVLVALIILAVGVLGFAALQFRAVEASSESLARSQSTTLLRGLTESIRANATGQKYYAKEVQKYSSMTSTPTIETKCLNVSCTAENMAAYDAYLVGKAANQLGINITMTKCPGVQTIERQCLFAVWKDTKIKDKTDYSDCMSTSGVYKPLASCVMMEAY